MIYKFHESGKAKSDFTDAFGSSASCLLSVFYDGLMSVVFGCIQIDPIKFDDYLYRKHEDYIEGVSMRDIVLKHYGEKGLRVLEALLPPEDGDFNEKCDLFGKFPNKSEPVFMEQRTLL